MLYQNCCNELQEQISTGIVKTAYACILDPTNKTCLVSRRKALDQPISAQCCISYRNQSFLYGIQHCTEMG